MLRNTLIGLCIAGVLMICSTCLANPVYSPVTGHWYELTDEWFWTFDDAQAFAVAKGGHLATVTSAAENLWISQTWYDPDLLEYVMLGGSDARVEGTWEWVTGEPWVFTNWIGIEPNNGAGGEDWLGFKTWAPGSTTWWVDGVGYGWLDMGRQDNPVQYRALIEYEADPSAPGTLRSSEVTAVPTLSCTGALTMAALFFIAYVFVLRAKKGF